jgi:hypothetical protein
MGINAWIPTARETQELIERQSRGLLEFVEPRWDMDMWIGHPPIKQRLREDARCCSSAANCGRCRWIPGVRTSGTGKDFLAQCVAGEIGLRAWCCATPFEVRG